ncbi:unnamed protein product [Eruca vesicaria subsp. sativa]|uniref:Uncharacterized protein n=1 Tax=Eruca vesicaria subsp. sativa TaxID=29727 RepID=A0ABC8KDQ4_ERUVS|nr:unnamed protein product [Eruca vesicaria subsp. sativa]
MEAVEVVGPTQELIDSICIESGDYQLCKEIIHKHLDTKTTNLLDLMHLIFRIATEHASDTYVFISNILRGHPDTEETTGLKNLPNGLHWRNQNFLENSSEQEEAFDREEQSDENLDHHVCGFGVYGEKWKCLFA